MAKSTKASTARVSKKSSSSKSKVKKTKSSSSAGTKKKAATKVASPVKPASPKVSPAAKAAAEPKPKKSSSRAPVNKESVQAALAALVDRINAEITARSETKTKKSHNRGIQFLKGIRKEINRTAKDVGKLKVSKPRAKNPNRRSGFDKELHISEEVADLTGLDANQKYTRSHVVSKIFGYIKENELYNPECKKYLIPDDRLMAILDFDVELKDGTKVDPDEALKTLTYFSMQRYIQHNFIKE